MSSGWSWYITILVASNLLGCVWLLWWTAKRRPGDPKPEDTSHVWDETLTEYNKPLPRWWINMFYLTIIFSVGYLLWFPGVGNFIGIGEWTSRSEHDAKKQIEDAKLEATFKPYAGLSIDVLAKDPKALTLGRSIFSNTCATCHGSSAKGAVGYPNLTDDIWQWGGTPDRILETVLDGRDGIMTPWGEALEGIGGKDAVDYTVAYVMSLSQPPGSTQNDYMVSRGQKLYEGICVACHGVDGKGNIELGAPDQTDNYWLYGGSAEAIRNTIVSGRHGIMPAHREQLGETRSRLAAAYVWSLSHPALGERSESSKQ